MKTLRRILSVVLAVCMMVGTLTILPLSVNAAKDIDGCAPAGTSNVAVGSTVTVSKCTEQRAGSENSYEMPSENWCKAMLVDGLLNNGWSTQPYDKENDRFEPVTLTIKLPSASKVSAIALFPNGCFPAKYTLSLSADGKSYKKVADGTCSVGQPTEPAVHTFAETSAQYVQIHVTERSLKVTNDGALVQFGEVAIYGKPTANMKLDRAALELLVGETDTLVPTFIGVSDKPTITFESDNTAVATVDKNGKITAKALGSANIKVTCSAYNLTQSCKINVVEKKFDFDDNILLSIFWPPTPDYINDEQYQLIADAGINWVLGAGEETLATPEIQQKMLELCAKYGIGMTVSDGNFGKNLLGKSDAQIAKYVGKYQNVPGAYGFYILDEPFNPNEYVDAYIALKKANPEAYMHLNFLPGGAYGSQERYYSQMNDWCVLCADGGYDVDYLIFDNYPFPLSGEMNRQGFMENLRTCHDVGLANDVKTGTYIQTVCQEVAFRRPSNNEIRYEMYLALAFGYKQLSFFTWFTPVNRSEPFKDGIISANGVPNAHYEAIKQINHEILAIGDILVKCDALEIYLNGQTWGQPSIPEDFFVQPADKKNYTVSYLRHKETNANYLMVVNNNYNSKQSISLNFDKAITSLSEVSRTDGSLKALKMDGQKLTIELNAGDAMLIALPEGYDYYAPNFTENPTPGTNLATLPEASVSANASLGGDGYYINLLTDGKRTSTDISKGWATATNELCQVTLDLGAVRKVNRVDLYPAGDLFSYGDTFPEDFEVLVSQDGKTYVSVGSVKDFKVEETGKSVTFDTTDAQYVRIEFPKQRRSVTLCEIEVYNDDGTVGPIPSLLEANTPDGPIDYKDGDNIALKKPTYVSSAAPDVPYKSWGWSQSYINDGITGDGNGFTSNVGRNPSPDATEYVIIDFCDVFALESVKITPIGSFPENYQVQISVDGKNWADIANVKGAGVPNSPVEIKPEDGSIPARFLKFMGTKLRGGGVDGYLLQFSEIEAYGKPICDKTVIQDAMKAYTDDGGDISAKVYTDAQAALEDATLTQSQADAYAEALLALVKPPVVPDETETNDSETTADTSKVDTSDTQGDDTTTSPSTSQDTTNHGDKGGCASVISSSLLLMATVTLAGISLRKKKEN